MVSPSLSCIAIRGEQEFQGVGSIRAPGRRRGFQVDVSPAIGHPWPPYRRPADGVDCLLTGADYTRGSAAPTARILRQGDRVVKGRARLGSIQRSVTETARV